MTNDTQALAALCKARALTSAALAFADDPNEEEEIALSDLELLLEEIQDAIGAAYRLIG